MAPTGVPAASVMRPCGLTSTEENAPAARREVQVAPASVLTQMSPTLPKVQIGAGLMPGWEPPGSVPIPAGEGRKVGPQEATPLATQLEIPPACPVYWMLHTDSGRCAAAPPGFGRSSSA